MYRDVLAFFYFIIPTHLINRLKLFLLKISYEEMFEFFDKLAHSEENIKFWFGFV